MSSETYPLTQPAEAFANAPPAKRPKVAPVAKAAARPEPPVIVEEDRKVPPLHLKSKSERIKDFDVRLAPAAARTYTLAEKVTMEFVDNFRRQFVQLYPARPRLFLTPQNECCSERFIATTVRPTQLPFHETYDWQGAAQFVADFLAYQPLNPPTAPPSFLPSSGVTLEWQIGDSFDFALLLTSLLIGAGYDAYCVYGRAAKELTLMDQTRMHCPLLPQEQQQVKAAPAGKANSYVTRQRPVLKSQFIRAQAARKQEELAAQHEEREQAIRDQEARDDAKAAEDALFGRRVHAWVLVRGRREIAEPFFIEATTGRRYPLSHSQYHGVDSVWNDKNSWLNMQEAKVNSLEGMSFNLEDTTCWEFVLHPESLTGDDDERRGGNDEDGSEDARSASPSPEETKPTDKPKLRILEAPASWVPPLNVPRDKFEERFPGGYKSIDYLEIRLERWAPYVRKNDGLRQRMTFFEDMRVRTIISEVREDFANRKDHLLRRTRHQLSGKVDEEFSPGLSPFHIKRHIFSDDRSEMTFYEAHHNGLTSRCIQGVAEMKEEFARRDDFLTSRTAVFSKAPVRHKKEHGFQYEIKCRIMEETFAPEPGRPIQNCVAKRTFLQDDIVVVAMHCPPERISAKMWTYQRTPVAGTTDKFNVRISSNEDTLSDADHDKMRPDVVDADFALLLLQRTACDQAVGASLLERDRILSGLQELRGQLLDGAVVRPAFDEEMELTVSAYDVKRNRERRVRAEGVRPASTEVFDEARDEHETGEFDFLLPYLQNLRKTTKSLTPQNRDEAVQVKSSCLKDFQTRTLERAAIIQARLSRLDLELGERQIETTGEEQDEYQAQIVMKINVLLTRLKELKETFKDRYEALDEKIKADPRMRPFFT